jgi:hypothetical protein
MKTSIPSWESLAPRLAANGYCALPIERSEIEHYGREQPGGGGWAYGLATPDKDQVGPEYYAAWSARQAPGVLCGRLPIEGGSSRTECEATRIAAVRVTANNSNMAASLEAIVREHVGAIGPVVRLSRDDASLLIPFRICEDARAFNLESGRHIDSENYMTVGSAGTAFLADGWNFQWRDGVSLVDVPRSDLVELKLRMVRPLIDAANAYLRSQQAPAPPTGRELRLQARVAHRLQCGTCARCVDAKVGDWVTVQGWAWPATQIESVDEQGRFFIKLPDGTLACDNGHRLFPTAAPVAPEPQRTESEIFIGGFHRAPLTGTMS